MISLNKKFTILLIAILFWIAIFSLCQDIFLCLILWVLLLLFIVIFFQYFYKKIFLSVLVIAYFGAAFGVSVTYMDWNYRQENSQMVDSYMWLWTKQEWEVVEVYRRSDFYDEYTIKIQKLGDTKVDKSILSLVRIPKNFVLYPGQKISYSGKLYPLEDFNGFSYQKFMLSKWIYYSSSTSSFETLSDNRVGIKYFLFEKRERLLSRIEKIFPQKEVIFLGGILLWARENIPKDLKEDFNNSGLTHFIAVSGFNITLCVIFVTFLFWFLPMWGRIIMVTTTIIGFSFFVWLGAPVVRAAIMWILAYMFLQSGSSVKNITLLAFTAVCMCLFSPLVLLYDVSFHLSFLAVIGIIYTQQIFQKLFSWVPDFFAIREALVLTLASLSFTLPIMMFQFGQVSLFAPFANIAVTWTIPLAMLTGAISLILDMFSPTLGNISGFIPWVFLKYDMFMVSFFWNLESALVRFDFWPYKNYLEAWYFIVLTYFLTLYHSAQKNQP